MEYLQDNVHQVLVHQTKIGEVFIRKTDSALLDDGSDDVKQMQIPHLIPFIEASFMRAQCKDVLSEILPFFLVTIDSGYSEPNYS